MQRENSSKQTLISVVIPTYKQEKTIIKDIKNIKSALDELGYRYEIIIVIDGIVDKTYQKSSMFKSKKIKIIAYEKNQGKGHAVSNGMMYARGDIIGFIDAGMDIHPAGVKMLLNHMEWYNADIIVGSKLHPVSRINYPWQRKILSRAYRILVKALFGLKIRDTQTGMKFFKREVIEDVLPRLVVKKYAFDIELLAVAYHLGHKRIFEAPIQLDFTGYSSITSNTFLYAIFKMLWDTFAVFYRLRIIRYYTNQKSSKIRKLNKRFHEENIHEILIKKS